LVEIFAVYHIWWFNEKEILYSVDKAYLLR
jgi:hypothetical protein